MGLRPIRVLDYDIQIIYQMARHPRNQWEPFPVRQLSAFWVTAKEVTVNIKASPHTALFLMRERLPPTSPPLCPQDDEVASKDHKPQSPALTIPNNK